jgi:hypothetical protein
MTVKDADPDERDWLRLQYKRTVPSPRPTVRWEIVADRGNDGYLQMIRL